MNARLIACRVHDLLNRVGFSRKAIESVARYELHDSYSELIQAADVLERDVTYPALVDQLDATSKRIDDATMSVETELTYLGNELDSLSETLEALGVPMGWAEELHQLEENVLYARFAVRDEGGVLDEDLDAALAYERTLDSIDELLSEITKLRGFKGFTLPAPPETELEVTEALADSKPETEHEAWGAELIAEAAAEPRHDLDRAWEGLFASDEFEIISLEELMSEVDQDETESESESDPRWGSIESVEDQSKFVFDALTKLSEYADAKSDPELDELVDTVWAELIELDFQIDATLDEVSQAITV